MNRGFHWFFEIFSSQAHRSDFIFLKNQNNIFYSIKKTKDCEYFAFERYFLKML